MIREERSASFWQAISEHPDVAPFVGPCSAERWAMHPDVLPMACDYGGWIGQRLDALGLVWGLHAMMTSEGRGRASHAVCVALLKRMFAEGAQIVTASELAANRYSRAPLSFGFRPIGRFVDTPLGPARLWTLTRQAWDQSAASRRPE